jgi:acetyl esterase/lipase
MWHPGRFVAVGVLGATVWGSGLGRAATDSVSGLQDFAGLAPADVRAGRITLRGAVVHRALDGSWIKIKPDSKWGRFSYRVSPETPVSVATPATAVAAWQAIRISDREEALTLTGEIETVGNGGAEFEGDFAFADGTLRLKFLLVENDLRGSDPMPSQRNVPYGPDARQVLDLYRAAKEAATPVAIYIHGGAWIKGDKADLTGIRELLDAGISVVAINYRYCPPVNPSADVPAVAIPLKDAARALQFVRSKAGEWNLDRRRVGVWGISAGACSALWLATHPDQADATGDAVSRKSTRPYCAAGIYAQTSLDPVEMREWVGPRIAYGAHAFGLPPADTPGKRFDAFIEARPRLLPWLSSYSPSALLSSDDPPLFLDYLDFSLTPNEPLEAYYAHSPGFGIGFSHRAASVGAECHLRYAGQEDARFTGWKSFLIQTLTGATSL